MSGLSEREQRILEYMREYVAKWGYPPTVRDVAGALGIKSTSTVHKSIAALEKAGAIKKQAGKRRALDIVGSEPAKAPSCPSSAASRPARPSWRSRTSKTVFPCPAALSARVRTSC